MTHYLSILLFLPLVGAILLLFISKEKEDTFRWVANGVTLLEFVISIPLWFSFNPQNPDFQFVERAPWKLAKTGHQDALDEVLYTAAESLRLVTALLSPVIPESTAKIWKQLGFANSIEDIRQSDLQIGRAHV